MLVYLLIEQNVQVTVWFGNAFQTLMTFQAITFFHTLLCDPSHNYASAHTQTD